MRAFDQSEDDANEDLATSRYALAAAVGDPAPPTEAGVVHFSKSYMAHGEPVSRITLRRPVTKEIRTAGTPFRIVLKADGVTIEDVEQRWDAVAKYIELLATPPLPPHTVDQLEFEDLAACAGVLFDFFLPTSRSKKS